MGDARYANDLLSDIIKNVETNKKLAIFEGKKIRRIWDEKQEKWYFSVVDIIAVLTDSDNPQVYWRVLKKRLIDEGSSETVTKCNGLKMMAQDGKMRLTDVADVETLMRLIQSVPSPKAEPIKLWLAKVGYERIQETTDPEKSIDRGRKNWQRMGRNNKWIQQRMMGQEIRNKLTDYWKNNQVKEQNEYAILTNIIHQEWSDVSVKEHKILKKIKIENLRNHMTDAELVFTALAELSTRQIAEVDKAIGFEPNKSAGLKGGRVAKNARIELEQKTGRKVISTDNLKLPSSRNKRLT